MSALLADDPLPDETKTMTTNDNVLPAAAPTAVQKMNDALALTAAQQEQAIRTASVNIWNQRVTAVLIAIGRLPADTDPASLPWGVRVNGTWQTEGVQIKIRHSYAAEGYIMVDTIGKVPGFARENRTPINLDTLLDVLRTTIAKVQKKIDKIEAARAVAKKAQEEADAKWQSKRALASELIGVQLDDVLDGKAVTPFGTVKVDVYGAPEVAGGFRVELRIPQLTAEGARKLLAALGANLTPVVNPA